MKRALNLLTQLIAVESVSRSETASADILQEWLTVNAPDATVGRIHNNVYAVPRTLRADRPLLLLNSHHDTVPPCQGWVRDPFKPDIEGDRLYGLGSNDAGASAVALTVTFADLLREDNLPVNLLLAITAEEEVTGINGMRALLPHLAEQGFTPDMAIVGEPTGMQCALAERGLVVLDGVTTGRAGHAARSEGVNALYLAVDDINRLRQMEWPRRSDILGPIGVNVTCINAGSRHNIVPGRCEYVVDVRTTDAYTNEQTVEMIRQAVKHSSLTPRSTHIRASVIPKEHPLVQSAISLGCGTFVSPTVSDRAVLTPIPALKIGPGQSARSHTADEYVTLSELNDAIRLYPRIIRGIRF